ncbi:hypothetical protein [Actinokineospora sp. NPDC004072]
MTPTTIDVPTPVDGLPVLGDLAHLADTAARGLGMPFWLRGVAVGALVAVLLYVGLRLLVAHLLPKAEALLAGPLTAVLEGVRAVLLLPDLGAAWLWRRLGRIPPEVVYAYGAVVMTVVDGTQKTVRTILPMLGAAHQVKRWMLGALVVLAFVAWNGGECVAGSGPGCVSPADQWALSLTSWLGGR